MIDERHELNILKQCRRILSSLGSSTAERPAVDTIGQAAPSALDEE